MKNLTQLIAALILVTALTSAQADGAKTNLTSGLQLSTRTDEERCAFLLSVAKAYTKESDFEATVQTYERVLKIDPNQKEARYFIALAYIETKEYVKSETKIMSLMKDFPDDFRLKNNLAWLYATAEDLSFRDAKKAVQIAQEAMMMAPKDHHVWSTLSEAHYAAGEYEKAYRDITHMAALAANYATDITPEMVENYNEQIRKCKRAWETKKLLEGMAEDE